MFEVLAQSGEAKGLGAACVIVIGGIALAGSLYFLFYGRK